MVKKLSAIILVFLLVVALSACGAKEDVLGEVTYDDTSSTDVSAKKDTSDTAKTSSEEVTFSTGKSEGTKYENKFIGIGCNLDGWTLKTDEEIKETNELALQMVGSDYKSMIENASTITDMYAVGSNNMDTIGVNLEKVSGPSALMTEESYLSSQKDLLNGALGSMGLEDIKSEIKEFEFAGKKRFGIAVTASINGIDMFETIIVVKCNGYFANITVCTWMQDNASDVLSKFYKVK